MQKLFNGLIGSLLFSCVWLLDVLFCSFLIFLTLLTLGVITYGLISLYMTGIINTLTLLSTTFGQQYLSEILGAILVIPLLSYIVLTTPIIMIEWNRNMRELIMAPIKGAFNGYDSNYKSILNACFQHLTTLSTLSRFTRLLYVQDNISLISPLAQFSSDENSPPPITKGAIKLKLEDYAFTWWEWIHLPGKENSLTDQEKKIYDEFKDNQEITKNMNITKKLRPILMNVLYPSVNQNQKMPIF